MFFDCLECSCTCRARDSFVCEFIGPQRECGSWRDSITGRNANCGPEVAAAATASDDVAMRMVMMMKMRGRMKGLFCTFS